jgi:hypothetical protein
MAREPSEQGKGTLLKTPFNDLYFLQELLDECEPQELPA